MSIAVPDYEVYAVGQSFISSAYTSTSLSEDPTIRATQEMIKNRTFEHLDNADCIDAYAQMVQTKRRNLLLVASDESYNMPEGTNTFGNDSHIYWQTHYQGDVTTRLSVGPTSAYYWICSSLAEKIDDCTTGIYQIEGTAHNWMVSSYCNLGFDTCGTTNQRMSMTSPIQYCLSEAADQRCNVKWNLPIAALVTALNFLKVTLILYTALLIREDPLMTLGDAIASSLRETIQLPTYVSHL